jgi:hypothetical protein
MAEESPLPPSEERGPVRSDELIDEAGKESFPASDPPAIWSGVDHRDMDAGGSVDGAEGPRTGSG